MKKILVLMLIGVMVLCCSCGSSDSAKEDTEKTQVSADTQDTAGTTTPADDTTPVPTEAPTPVPTEAPVDDTPMDTTDFDPNGDIAPEFCAVWKYSDDTESDNFIGIYYGNTFVIVDDESYIEGTVKPLSPDEIQLIGNDGTEIMTLTMSSLGTLLTEDGRSLFYYLDVVDERLNEDNGNSYAEAFDISDEELEVYFNENCFYSVDNEFNADVMRALFPFVGCWTLQGEREYFIDETFAYRGIMIYADNAWTWVNAYGIPAMTPGQITSADQNSITLYDATTDSVFTLTMEDPATGLLAADNGDTYAYQGGTHVEYPLQGAPVEVLGKWASDEGFGNFLIDRTGMVVFDDAPDIAASVSTLSVDAIAITIGDESTEISIYEAPAGILVDSLGTVYYRAE